MRWNGILAQEFGCCSDWYTPAEGPNQAGCPQFVLGTCNDTKFGCCPDQVTLARGPDFAGCGEPSCAASMYGCCKDRRTIAFGPNYAGCERSSFPCELSEHGCCSDGVTAALGPNGTGCGASCLLTKYGCCPDGVSQSKGPNNEGCGCEYSQYGCCPNGKDSAKGPGFYGMQLANTSCAFWQRLSRNMRPKQVRLLPGWHNHLTGPKPRGLSVPVHALGMLRGWRDSRTGPIGRGLRRLPICKVSAAKEDDGIGAFNSRHGCCPDGVSKAIGPEYAGCPTTTAAPYILGGTVSPSSIGKQTPIR